ncbi:hypothetical protein [Kordiimonas sp.]|uniref:hypothetical protein n=1 Tax=Kordiimonas sp. TaxID=1970157 RepID=UPI003A8D21EE
MSPAYVGAIDTIIVSAVFFRAGGQTCPGHKPVSGARSRLGLAIGYNVVSQLAADSGRRALAPTELSFGILMMSVQFVIWSGVGLMPLAGWAALMAVYISYPALWHIQTRDRLCARPLCFAPVVALRDCHQCFWYRRSDG